MNDTFIKELQSRLLSQGDMISSANTQIESKIQQAITGIQQSASASSQAVSSQYDRQIGYTQEANNNQLTALRERGVGMQTSDVAYRSLSAEADKNIKDLEQRKQELILQGQASAASKIADLQIQTLDFKTKALQQTYSNILAAGSFAVQGAQESRLAKAQNFAEEQAIANVGLEYGIPIYKDDTLDSVVKRAAPTASQEKKLQLAKLQADINQSNASAAKARSDMSAGQVPKDRNAAVRAMANDPTGFSKLYEKNPDFITGIAGEAAKLQVERGKEMINRYISEEGLTKEEAYTRVQNEFKSPLVDSFTFTEEVLKEAKKAQDSLPKDVRGDFKGVPMLVRLKEQIKSSTSKLDWNNIR